MKILEMLGFRKPEPVQEPEPIEIKDTPMPAIGDDVEPSQVLCFGRFNDYQHCLIAENGKVTWTGTQLELFALIRKAAREANYNG